MTKKQKIWLAVSASLFLTPEILWSPLWNFSYELWFKELIDNKQDLTRINFLTSSDNADILIIIFAIQAVGFSSLFFWSLFSTSQKIIKISGLIFSILGIIAIIFAFIMFYSFRAWR